MTDFYRYEETHYAAPLDEYEHPTGRGSITVDLLEYDLVSETKCGHWIKPKWDYSDEFKKWVSNSSVKRYAYPTKEEALKGFIARKKRQCEILSARLQDAKYCFRVGEELLAVTPPKDKE